MKLYLFFTLHLLNMWNFYFFSIVVKRKPLILLYFIFWYFSKNFPYWHYLFLEGVPKNIFRQFNYTTWITFFLYFLFHFNCNTTYQEIPHKKKEGILYPLYSSFFLLLHHVRLSMWNIVSSTISLSFSVSLSL